jgi:molybdopterin converting factor small subunit
VKIVFYGRMAEVIAREAEVDLPPEGNTIGNVRQALAEIHPYAAEHLTNPSIRPCVRDRVVTDDYRITNDDVVEFFPPLSGG